MNVFTKASFGLIALAALMQGGAAHALATLDVKPTVTAPAAGSNAPYQYSYAVMPSNQFPFTAQPESSLDFYFTDPNITYVSNTGPLDVVTSTGPGSFHATSSDVPTSAPETMGSTPNAGSTSPTLNPGDMETFVFTSFDGPQGTLNVTGSGFPFPDISGPVTGPAAVPEASSTVSFGLLLMLGGAVVAARKKKLAA